MPTPASPGAREGGHDGLAEASSDDDPKTTLIDVTKCIGCRACQVACKNWNDCEGEQTELLGHLGLQNPASLSAEDATR